MVLNKGTYNLDSVRGFAGPLWSCNKNLGAWQSTCPYNQPQEDCNLPPPACLLPHTPPRGLGPAFCPIAPCFAYLFQRLPFLKECAANTTCALPTETALHRLENHALLRDSKNSSISGKATGSLCPTSVGILSKRSSSEEVSGSRCDRAARKPKAWGTQQDGKQIQDCGCKGVSAGRPCLSWA